VSGSSFVANRAGDGGANTANLPSSGFGGYGGAVHVPGSVPAVIERSTFSQNAAGDTLSEDFGGSGGAVSALGPAVALRAATLTGNSAPGDGGGIYAGGASVITVSDTLLANNTAAGLGPACGQGGTSIADGGHNIAFPADPDFCPAGFAAVDPLLDPAGPVDNGGPTPTVKLLAGSPAIDAIPNGDCGSLTTDQRGLPRPSPAGGACDIGAFEVQAAPAVCPAVAPKGLVGNLLWNLGKLLNVPALKQAACRAGI
jgi:predicted outer membrane repeat protein